MCADVWAIIISTLGRQDIIGHILLVIFQDTPERQKRFGQWIVSETDICYYRDFSCRAAGGICAIYLPRRGFHICSKANLQKIRLPSHKLIKSTQTDWTQFERRCFSVLWGGPSFLTNCLLGREEDPGAGGKKGDFQTDTLDQLTFYHNCTKFYHICPILPHCTTFNLHHISSVPYF